MVFMIFLINISSLYIVYIKHDRLSGYVDNPKLNLYACSLTLIVYCDFKTVCVINIMIIKEISYMNTPNEIISHEKN